MKRLFGIIVFFVLLISLYAIAEIKTTTVMLYMCGTDIEEDALTDLKEICKADTGSNIRIVVLAGGTKNWSDSRLRNKKLNLFTIDGDQWSQITDWGSASMGSPDTLKRFISYCWTNNRSDRNVLIMWDHGSAAIDGLCFDEVYNDDALTLNDLSKTFSELRNEYSGFHLDIIGADACLMASYEMAATLSPYADYYIASEELEPWLGWYYTNWLKALNSNPSMTNRELATAVVDSYIYGCNRDDPNDYLTLSAIDLSKISTLSQYIDNLAATLSGQINNGQMNAIARTVQSLYVFGNYDDAGSDMIDLNDFLNLCEKYDSATTQKARNAYQSAVVYNYANKYVPSATGLSIFVPVENKSSVSKYLSSYSTAALTGYTSFVSAFAGASSSSWSFSSNNSGPNLLDSGSNDASFLSSFTSWFNGANYSYGTGFGYNTSGIVIAGTGTQTSKPTATPATTASIANIVIAGKTATPVPAPVLTPTPTPSIRPSATAATASASINLNSSYAFSVTLSDDDMHYLSHAELMLYQDFSDEDGWDIDELGRVRDTWIDWDNNKVYAVFDGTWSSINDIYVVMYEQSRTQYGRRCIIPIILNDMTKTYLVVEYDGNDTNGRIIGTSMGWSDNGLPVRGVTPLNIGDTFTPIYPSFTSSSTDPSLKIDVMSSQWTVYNDPEFIITWNGSQTVTNEELSDQVEYKLAFCLHDIFGGKQNTNFITFTIE